MTVEQYPPQNSSLRNEGEDNPSKIGFVSLGCPKNSADSERILTQLRAEGYSLSASYENSDLVIVNTCGFIDAAVEESLQAIGEALAENGKVIVTGCLGVRDDEIRQVHPGVLAVTGPHAYEEVIGQVHKHCPPKHDPYMDLVPPQGVRLTPKHYAYLKISEGCNHKCTFCIIPSMRGKLVSRPVGNVLDEASRLVQSGVKELLVISQDTSAYGVDVKYVSGFWQGQPVKTKMLALCEALAEMGVWIRLHYVYPYPHVDQVIPLMAAGKILPYLDIPFQHASHRVLKAMKRPAHAENVLERIKKWRQICPQLTIRSTFIVGFPGETEEDFQILLDWLDAAQLDRVGCFKYSAVDGAVANQLEGHVAEDVAEERWQRFMQKSSEISAARLALKVGSIQQVLVDAIDGEYAIARSQADAPEIDGVVVISGASHVSSGEMVEVKITASDDYDLFAELV